MSTRWARRLRDDDRGAASVELVIATPLLLLLLLSIVQYAVWSHATHIAQAAASHGLAATRVDQATTADGHAAAQQLLDQLGRGPLIAPNAVVHRTPTSASVRITGYAATVVPGVRLPVRAEAVGPAERWTAGR